MHSALYQQTKTCPVCEQRFTLTRVRTSACTVLKRDTDFRVQYSAIDPNLYSVWACPRCGYAASETTFEHLEPEERRRVREALAERPLPQGVEGERTPEGAIASYEQALYLGMIRKLSPSNLAGLHLKLAWIYRGLGEVAKEREHLAEARDLYRQAFDHEHLGREGKMSETTVAYLVGELSRRLGDYATAITWFSRLVSDPRTKQEPQILNLAREQWYLARQQATGEEAEDADEVAAAGKAAAPQGGGPAAVTKVTGEGSVPADASVANEGGRSFSAVLAARVRAGKISSMVPLYRDQVEWLRKVVAAGDEIGSRLMLPDAVRAVLDLAVLRVPPDRLAARNEEELRRKLFSLFQGPVEE
ncbi:MAG: DUF2225 domain-containing protein [Betaproteobacteria bacterium]